MTDAKPDLRRLSQLPEHEDPHHLAELFRSAKAAPQKDLPRLRWRLRVSLQQRATRGRRFLRIAVTASTLFLAGGVLGAVVVWQWKPRASAPPSPTVLSERATAKPSHRRRLATPTEAKQAETPAATTDEIPVAQAAMPSEIPRPARRLALDSAPRQPSPSPPAPPVAPPVAAQPSPIAVEHALLGDVLRSLRQHGDAKAALALLDEHARGFPTTVLAPEAAMLRAEALLALGRNTEALAELDRTSPGSMPNQAERFVIRAELRAAAGRWREAGDDFDRAIASEPSSGHGAKARELKERALWGRASAKSHLGDVAGARNDLAAYLQAFPSGRFATRATQLLEETK